MCIALFSSEVPIQILLMQEQVICNTDSGEFNVREYYDVVFVNRGDKSIRNLMLISPHLLYTKEATSQDSELLVSTVDASEEFLNSYMNENGVETPELEKNRVAFSVPSYVRGGGQLRVALNAVRLWAQPSSLVCFRIARYGNLSWTWSIQLQRSGSRNG